MAKNSAQRRDNPGSLVTHDSLGEKGGQELITGREDAKRVNH